MYVEAHIFVLAQKEQLERVLVGQMELSTSIIFHDKNRCSKIKRPLGLLTKVHEL